MIVSAVLDLLKVLITSIFGILPNIPNVPSSIVNGINGFLDIIFDNVGLLGIFVPIDTIKVVVPIAIVITNFDHIYKLVLWIIKKIPMLGMS